MLQTNYQKFVIFLLISCSLLVFFLSTPVLARDFGLKDTIEATKDSEGNTPYTEKPIQLFVGDIIGAILAFTGVIFFLFMVIGGTVWLNAQGNEQTIEKAKQIITGSVFGLAIVLAAYGLTAFVGQVLTNTK